MPEPTVNLKLRVFISSVQKELAEERMQLKVLLTTDPFLLRHTVPKLFEKYPAPLRPDQKAYLKLLEKCQIYVLIIGKEYGASGESLSATHIEYNRAQELSLPTLVCVKGNNQFDRDEREEQFFKSVRDAGHTYSRFENLDQLHEVAHDRLIEHIKDSYELTPSKVEQAVAEATLAAASLFDRQRVFHRELQELKVSHLNALATAVDPESRKILKPKDREQLLLERGFLWFNNSKNSAHPTAAGLILTAKDPTAEFPQARVQLDIYRGKSNDDEAIIAESIHKNIPDAIDTSVATIYQNTRKTPRIVGLKRVELPEYPEVALREALVNALAHRDYEDSSQRVFVEVFFDRIVITNPGKPVGHPSLKKLEEGKARSRSRNPLISQGLVFLRRMEERGTGIRRMRRAMLDYGLDAPQFAVEDDRFVLTLPGPAHELERIKAPQLQSDTRPDSVIDELNKRQREILELAIKSGSVTNRQVQETFDVVRDTAHRDLLTLCDLNLLEKEGSGRSTHYKPQAHES